KNVRSFTHRLSGLLYERENVRRIPKVPTNIAEENGLARNFQLNLHQLSVQFKYPPNRQEVYGKVGTVQALHCLRNQLLLRANNATTALYKNNLLNDQRDELHKLTRTCRSRDIVVRKADKSAQIVILTTDQYRRGVLRVLSDDRNYESVQFN